MLKNIELKKNDRIFYEEHFCLETIKGIGKQRQSRGKIKIHFSQVGFTFAQRNP